MRTPRAWAVPAVLTLILLGALILRLIGLQYGLPAVYNPDEVAIMARALSFAKGTLNPHNFLYPTLYFYGLFAWVGTYLAFVWLTGGVSSVAALQELYFTDPTRIYTAGRLLTAACGTATTLALYRLGHRLFDVRVGMAAAAFLAVAPLAVRDAHYVKHDVPATLAVLIAFIAIVRIWPGGNPQPPARHEVLVAAAACGIAFSTHYYCIFLAIPLAWAIAQRWREAGWHIVLRHLVTGAIISAVVFFALSPFILVEPIVAWRDIVANRRIVVDRAVDAGAFGSAARYLEILWRDSMGGAVILLAIGGVAGMLVRERRRAVLLLAFALPFLAFIANTAPASRYLNPVLPIVAIFAAWTLAELSDRLRAPLWIYWIAVAGCAALPLAASVRTDLFFRVDDTRTLARRFVEGHIPSGASVLVQPYSVALTPSKESLIEALEQHVGDLSQVSAKFRIQLALDPYPQPHYRLIWLGRGGLDVDKIYLDPADLGGANRLTRLEQLGVSYVVLKRDDPGGPEAERLRAALLESAELTAEFSPYRAGMPDARRSSLAPFLHNSDTRIDEGLERPGPPIEIWRLNVR